MSFLERFIFAWRHARSMGNSRVVEWTEADRRSWTLYLKGGTGAKLAEHLRHSMMEKCYRSASQHNSLAHACGRAMGFADMVLELDRLADHEDAFTEDVGTAETDDLRHHLQP